MRLPPVPAPTGRDAVVIGVPYDGGTSYRPGARLAPKAIRHESGLIYGTGNRNAFGGLDVVDAADLDLGPLSRELAMANVTTALARLLRDNDAVLMLGGDHLISLPGIRAAYERHGQLAVLHLDAHSDIVPTACGGNSDMVPTACGGTHHHGPFQRALEDGLIHGPSMIQIGLRERTQNFWDAAESTVITALNCVGERGVRGAVDRIREVAGDRPLYMSVNVAVADPAFAPGTAMPAPGGLSRHEVLALLEVVGELNPVGFDVVGVCPPFDPSGVTALLAAEIGALLLYQYSRARHGRVFQRHSPTTQSPTTRSPTTRSPTTRSPTTQPRTEGK